MLDTIVTTTLCPAVTEEPMSKLTRANPLAVFSNVGTINCSPVLTFPYSVWNISVPLSITPNSLY